MNHTFKIFAIILFSVINIRLSYTQSISSQPFTVGGDFNKFYPVVFSETNWNDGASEFEITRSSVHINSDWRGSLVAKFRVHTTRWGNRSNFIDTEIKNSVVNFIADWTDATGQNGATDIIVWLRGGGTTYYFRSVNSVMGLPVVYLDGFQEQNGPLHTSKTDITTSINTNGLNFSGSIYANGNGVFLGNLLIGKSTQTNNTYKLDVAGKIRADEIVVNNTGADFVFEPTYKLRSLSELETFVKQNRHLPGIASAAQMQVDGVSVSEMQTKLLEKQEETSLYLIEQAKQITALKIENEQLKSELVEHVKKFEEHGNTIATQQQMLLELKKEIDNLKN